MMLAESPITWFPGEVDVLRLREWESTYEWTRRNFRLALGPQAGRLWDPDTAPYAKGIMDVWDRPEVRKVFLEAPSQGTTKTTIAYACGFARLCRKPGPLGIAMPDQDAVERIFRERVLPHFRNTAPLRDLLASDRYAEQKSSLLLRNGSIVHGLWAGSESRMSSNSLETLLIDEEDAYADRGAVATLQERVLAFEHTHKIMRFSKPRGTEEQSTIDRDMRAEAQVIFEWAAVCPACGTAQVMELEGIRVPEGVRDIKEIQDKRLARYVCTHCEYQWNDYVKNRAVAAGHWRPDREVRGATVVGFHLPSWVAQSMSLSKVMAQYFKAQREGPRALMGFDNSHKAVPYCQVTAAADEDALQRLVDHGRAAQEVPDRALALTFAVDTQQDHFWWSVYAHGLEPREEWLVDFGRAGTFEELALLIFHARYKREGGSEHLGIWRAAIDTGGTRETPLEPSRTMQVYRWLLSLPPGKVFGTKGMSYQRPGVHVHWNWLQKYPDGTAMKGGLRLYHLDTDAFKSEAMWRLSGEEGADSLRFHGSVTEQYFRQLLAERKQWEKGKEVWKKVRHDNHWLDCLGMHLAMTHFQWSPPLTVMAESLRRSAEASGPPAVPGMTTGDGPGGPDADSFDRRPPSWR